MSGPHRQLSTLKSLPKILGDSLPATLSPATAGSCKIKLNPRPVYPIKLAIEAEGLQQASTHSVQCLVELSKAIDQSVFAGIRSLYKAMPSAPAA